MQPITQASFDPKLNDIRHLRADQEFCGVIGCFGLISPHQRVETSGISFESYRLHRHVSVPNRDIQNPSVLATQRDSKGDSILVARREMQRRRRRAWTSMERLEVPRNSQEVRFSLGNQHVFQRRGRIRTRCGEFLTAGAVRIDRSSLSLHKIFALLASA
jgi:hypothetical protein